MGINVQSLKSLLHENRYKPISGRVLRIGKSTVNVSWPKLQEVLIPFGLSVSGSDLVARDVVTKRSSHTYWVDDVELFRVLFPGVESVDVLDMSPYEGANVIADMNIPIPVELQRKYDFIYDSSVLDNVFNPAQMIQNVSAMLRGGASMPTQCLILFPRSAL